ncbi:hypothetical protein CT19431_160065 [Cupriavidus taiwanensis]|nr:hypothetical protein CT19431_160065 [Cupriavidus taiwanensis]
MPATPARRCPDRPRSAPPRAALKPGIPDATRLCGRHKTHVAQTPQAQNPCGESNIFTS